MKNTSSSPFLFDFPNAICFLDFDREIEFELNDLIVPFDIP